MADEAITVAVSLEVRIDIPKHIPLGKSNPDDFIERTTLTAMGVIQEALRVRYPEVQPGLYEWASHSCGVPVSRCISVEGATLVAPTIVRKAIEQEFE